MCALRPCVCRPLPRSLQTLCLILSALCLCWLGRRSHRNAESDPQPVGRARSETESKDPESQGRHPAHVTPWNKAELHWVGWIIFRGWTQGHSATINTVMGVTSVWSATGTTFVARKWCKTVQDTLGATNSTRRKSDGRVSGFVLSLKGEGRSPGWVKGKGDWRGGVMTLRRRVKLWTDAHANATEIIQFAPLGGPANGDHQHLWRWCQGPSPLDL